MKADQEKNKKKYVAGWFNRVFPSRIVEFETPLTPFNCYERLQKLPGRMIYLNAKSKVELANAGIQSFHLNWLPEEDTLEFLHYTTRDNTAHVILQGKVFVSDIYETTLVQMRSVNDSNKPAFVGGYKLNILMLIILCIVAVILFRNSDIFPAVLGALTCLLLFPLFLLFAFVFARTRAEIKLIQNVLTEPDEAKL